MKWIGVSLFGAAVALAAPAAAQSVAAAASVPEVARGSSAAQASSPPAFEAALLEADRRFTQGDLAGALSILEPACMGTDRSDCAFNLGVIHHGLGHCEQALAHYRRYRQLAPEGEHMAEVEAALGEVEPRCGVGAGAGAAATASPVMGTGSPSLAQDASAASALPPASSASSPYMVGSFVLSGVTAVSSVVFGVLAANSASDCERAQVYDRAYIEECEQRGPSYQGMWQGFAVASAGFAGIGLTLWWFDSRSDASVNVSAAGAPTFEYRYRF